MKLAAGASRLALLLLVVLLGACASRPVITTDADPAADFARYRTFGFYEPLAVEDKGYSTPSSQRMKASTRREMEARGYVYDESNPDLRVNINAYISERQSVVSTPQLQQRLYYNYRANSYVSSAYFVNRTDVYNYTEGTLNIDLVDAARKQLVWEGVAVGRMANTKPTQRDARIDSTITEIFAAYPHRAGPN